MAPASRVLKFDRADNEGQYVLVNVTSRGSKPLDLKIEATEGDEEYAQNLRHDKVGSHMVKNCPVTDAEWQAILERLFTQEPQPDIQVTATVEAATSITVTVRKAVQGITQRLGSITIGVAEGSGFNVLDWCAAAVDAAAEGKAQVASTATKIRDLESTVSGLKRQLDELIRAKDEDETALLLKFRDLLNEKKVKIREQQKIIESGPPTHKDSQPAPPEQEEQSEPEPPKKGRKAAASRASKRKAPPTKVEEESEEEDFEPMEVDAVKSEAEATEREDDSEATASMASDDEEDPAPPEREVNTRASAAPAKQQPEKKEANPPAPRTLPFGKQKAKPPAKAPAPAGSDTESDDEL